MRNKIIITAQQQLDFDLRSAVLRVPTDILWRRHIGRLLIEAGAPVKICYRNAEIQPMEGWVLHSQVDHETKAIEISWEYRDSSLPANPTGLYILLLFICAALALGLYFGTIWMLSPQ